jgi:DNA-binding beta-propeller fold protein YncE
MTLTLAVSANPSEAVTKTFTASEDAHISEHYPDVSTATTDLKIEVINTCEDYGHCDRDGDGYVRTIPLVRFELSAIPPTSTITACELRLECWQLGYSWRKEDPRDMVVHAFRITSLWTESATWWTRPTWAEDLSPSVGIGSSGPVVIDDPALAEIVQRWVDGLAPNHGLALWPEPDRGTYVATFYSRETAPTAAEKPRLTVEYTPPPPGTVVEALRVEGFNSPCALSVDPADGSCWIADDASGEVVHLRADGAELWRGSGFNSPQGISVNPTDGSCWVGDSGNGQVVHIGQDGTQLRRIGGASWPAAVSVYPTDGSCWVADEQEDLTGSVVVRLAENGVELLRVENLYSESLSVNSVTGSCWATDNLNGDVIHFAQNGAELWRGAIESPCVSVNSADGSCWVADAANSQVVRLAEDGTELWRGGSISWELTPVSADYADGSCWVGDATEVAHFTEDGSELWRGGGFMTPRAVSVNPIDGSCWVADTGNGRVVRLVTVGHEGPRFPDVPPYHWAYDEIMACVDASIVKGYDDGLYHPEGQITRDQMAVYVARALVSPSGDAGIPDPKPPPSFPDVPATHWAYKHIEYAVSQNVVQGYEDGTYGPGITLDRGQMAVFIARAMVAPGGDAAVPDPEPPATFPDVPSGFWAYRHVEYCVEHGVVQGYDDGLYHPDYPCTRDQMAVYVARAFELPL